MANQILISDLLG